MAEAQLTNQLSRIDTMTNVELRAELKRRGCPTSGNKKDLLAKLRVALQKEYEQNAVETASTTSTIDSNSLTSLQQSPVVPFDVQRRQMINTPPMPPANQYVNYHQPMQNPEVPLTYHNLQMHDQAAGQYPPVYNLTMQQNVAAPMIPVPQQLTLSPVEEPAAPTQVTHESQPHIEEQQNVPAKKTRSRSKNASIDSRPVEMPIENTTTNDPIKHNEIPTISSNTIELETFVSKKSDEENQQTEREEIQREERRDSRSPSVGSSSAKSESVIKEIPLSGDRHRLSRSKSPKSRWHHSPSPQEQTINPPTVHEEPENLPTDSNKANETEEPKKEEEQPAAPKPARSISTTSSSSLMKGLNRTSGGNRMNLSSDVLKTLIPDISLAPESVVENELETTTNDETNGDERENSALLETSIGSGTGLLSESATIGESTDQRQQRNRTVVIDVAVDSSSLNDDLVGNNVEPKKKPIRMASFESKPLLDGKTNALMMDEPVRVKDVTVAHEPASQIIFIRGLTRPFTPAQLKELLGRYGTCVEGEFWLDKIKSQCFAMYNTLEEAQNAREALDGCRWPSTNPKTLSVRFARQDEFEFSKSHDLPPDQMPNGKVETNNNRSVQEKASTRRSASPMDEGKTTNNKKLRPMNNNDVREWDLPKIQQEKTSTGNERQVIEGESTKKTETPKAKGLDDYFRKTKAKPPIYWLPLTDEQVGEREQRREQRKVEREEEQRKRQNDENGRTSSNNNNRDYKSRPYRRSPSPRDKRKRVSTSPTSPSSSRRDNKRH